MTHTFHVGDFTTESGDTIPSVTVAYRTWGTLDASGGNAVMIGHALTGDPDAASWWPGLVGPGRLIDPERHFVVCANALGSCYGTTGPGTLDARGRRLGRAFPRITIRDQARLHVRLLDRLGVRSVALAAGGSMGGMQMAELALSDPERRVQRLLLIGMGAAHEPWQIGFSEAQRLAIRADRLWRNGDFAADRPPEAGLAAARAMAMMTYRSPALYQQRFGRALEETRGAVLESVPASGARGPLNGVAEPPPTFSSRSSASLFQIQSYLRYQGAKLSGRFDAGSYVALTEAMDAHDLTRDRSPEALATLAADALCIGISSDVLYPPEASCDLAARLPRGRYAQLDSPFGHDAFLVDFGALDALVRPFLLDTGFFA